MAKVAILRKDWLIPGTDPHAGGAERFAIACARRARDLGHEVMIAGADGRIDASLTAEFPAETIAPGSRIPALKNRAFAREGAAAAARLQAQGFRVLTLSQVPAGDVYRAGDGLHRVWLSRDRRGGFAGRLLRSLSCRHRTILRIEREILRAPWRHVVANSDLVAGHLREAAPELAPRVRTIRTGIDLTQFSPPANLGERMEARLALGIYDTRPIFLAIGRNVYRKGIDRAIRAVEAVPAASLWLLGCEGIAIPAGMQKRTRVLQPGMYEMSHLFRAASATLVLSRYDPLAQVTGESLACGAPVITSDWNGGCEYGPSEALITVPERDGEAAFQQGVVAAVAAWANHETHARLSPAARALAERWPAERQLDELLTLVAEG